MSFGVVIAVRTLKNNSDDDNNLQPPPPRSNKKKLYIFYNIATNKLTGNNIIVVFSCGRPAGFHDGCI